MSRTFKRPMFRKGGEVGGGIMTGIRTNYQEGSPKPSERIREAYRQFEQPAFDPVAQLLIQGGLRGLSETGGGSTLGNLAKAFEKPTSDFFTSKQAQQNLNREVAIAGVEADITSEQAAEKNRITQEIATLQRDLTAAEGDADRQNKIAVQIQKGKDKLAELQFKVDNPEASEFRTQQVTPAFENVVKNLTTTYAESKNPAVKSAPDLTAFNVTKFRREAEPEILSKYKGFKPYTFDTKGQILALPTDGYQAGDIIYDPVSADFLVFDNAGGTYRLDPLTFEIQE